MLVTLVWKIKYSQISWSMSQNVYTFQENQVFSACLSKHWSECLLTPVRRFKYFQSFWSIACLNFPEESYILSLSEALIRMLVTLVRKIKYSQVSWSISQNAYTFQKNQVFSAFLKHWSECFLLTLVWRIKYPKPSWSIVHKRLHLSVCYTYQSLPLLKCGNIAVLKYERNIILSQITIIR